MAARKNLKSVKRGEYASVSEKMGLPRLEKATPASCRARAKDIASLLSRGKIPAKLESKAKRWISTYKCRAKALKAA